MPGDEGSSPWVAYWLARDAFRSRSDRFRRRHTGSNSASIASTLVAMAGRRVVQVDAGDRARTRAPVRPVQLEMNSGKEERGDVRMHRGASDDGSCRRCVRPAGHSATVGICGGADVGVHGHRCGERPAPSPSQALATGTALALASSREPALSWSSVAHRLGPFGCRWRRQRSADMCEWPLHARGFNPLVEPCMRSDPVT
jgi:hypothetical protein